jgi:hypothetical protein
MAAIVIPASSREGAWAKEVTHRLRDDEPPAGLDRNERVCPVCKLVFVERVQAFGLCADDWHDITT